MQWTESVFVPIQVCQCPFISRACFNKSRAIYPVTMACVCLLVSRACFNESRATYPVTIACVCLLACLLACLWTLWKIVSTFDNRWLLLQKVPIIDTRCQHNYSILKKQLQNCFIWFVWKLLKTELLLWNSEWGS